MQLLENLPEGITELYSYCLQRAINARDGQIEITIKIFQWVVHARRPLTIGELEEAVSIKKEQRSWKSPSTKFWPSRLSKLCSNLIIVDEFDGTVSPAHHSVLSFLESTSNIQSFKDFYDRIHNAESYLGATCRTYLSFLDFQKPLITSYDTRNLRCMNSPSIFVTPVLSRPTFLHSIGQASWVNYLQRSRISRNYDAESQLRTIMGMARSIKAYNSFQLLDYCRANWHFHCRTLDLTHPKSLIAFKDFIAKTYLPFSWQPWDPPDDLDPYPHWPILEWALRSGHSPILRIWQDLLSKTEAMSSWNLLWKMRGDQLFSSACIAGNLNHINLFFDYRIGISYQQKGFFDRPPSSSLTSRPSALQILIELVRVSAIGHLQIVDLLLSKLTDTDVFSCAIEIIHQSDQIKILEDVIAKYYSTVGLTDLEAVKRAVTDLIRVPQDSNGDICGILIEESLAIINSIRVLQVACESGYLSIAELILRKYGSDNVCTYIEDENSHENVWHFEQHFEQNHLTYTNHVASLEAAKMGDLSLAMRLLQGIKISLFTAAMLNAAENGNLAVVERLLSEGYDNIQKSQTLRDIAIKAASRGGHLAVLRPLLQEFWNDIPKSINLHEIAIEAASENGHFNVVEQLLLNCGDDTSQSQYLCQIALQAASAGGHLALVKRLLLQTVSTNTHEIYFIRSPLEAAAENGHLLVVNRLLHEGFTVTDSALEYARRNGHLAVVQALQSRRQIQRQDSHSYRKRNREKYSFRSN